MSFMPTLKAYLYLFLFTPFTLLISGSAILATFLDGTGRAYHRHARAWSTVGLLLAGVRIRVEGASHIPSGPVIFMSNHEGNFDIFALFCAIPKQFAWIAKEELFKIPVFGHSMARAGYIPLDRESSRSALKSIVNAAAQIRNGRSVVIFPEGTRSPDGRLLPFKRGGFLVAAKSGVPIIPCTISGSREINPAKTLELYPGAITVRFGTPIASAATNDAERRQLVEKVRIAIESGRTP